MRILRAIFALGGLIACSTVERPATVDEISTNAAPIVAACSSLPSCPEAACDFPPGDAPDPTDDAGLRCLAIVAGNPCFCVPMGDGADTWCTLTAAQISGVNGTSCTSDTQCASGFCRDNKCCDSDCGGGGSGGNTGDCQACSVAHHGAQDGTCTTITDTSYVCRLYADPTCDLSERCDGASTACPADLGRNEGQICDALNENTCPANDATGAPHVCPN